MRTLSKKQKVTVAAVTLLALSGTGTLAYAYWTSNGAGDGAAATGDIVDIVVHQTSTVAGLYPDGPGVALAGDFYNTNAGPVRVASVTATVSAVTGNGGGPIACAPSDFVIEGGNGATANQTLVGAEIPPSATPTTGVGSWSGLTVRLVNTAANQDDCKNATLVVHYVSA